MRETQKLIFTYMPNGCSGCDQRHSCPLIKFQADYSLTDRSPGAFRHLAGKHNLGATFYVAENGIPHFRCPHPKGSIPGKIAIILPKSDLL